MDHSLTMHYFTVLIAVPALVAAQTACPFLPSASAPVIYFDLPAKTLSSPILDLPIKFQGIHPIVTRNEVPFGSTPKIMIKRYSSRPDIMYDEASETVIVTSATCSSKSTGESASPGRSSSGWIVVAATLMAGMVDERIRPFAATMVMLTSMMNIGVDGRALEEVCVPSVEVVVEAPSAYRGTYETCMAEITDPIVCPDPFPTFSTCSEAMPECALVVIGAGAGGLYTALR
jgi:hypothetical protein